MIDNNKVYMIGKVAEKPVFSHEVYSEGFYIFYIEIPRKSGNSDRLPVVVSERLININRLDVDRTVVINGQIRSYNQHIDNKHSHLILSVFARDIDILEDVEINSDVNNTVEIVGHICKEPVYRVTPKGREIADLMIGVGRTYGKSDYIPTVVWGRGAKFAGNLKIGDKIFAKGRFQSRKYNKCLDDGSIEERVAYELSVYEIDREESENEDN